MCLSVVYRGKQKKEALAKLPDSFYVWKVVCRANGGGFVTDCELKPLYGGEVEFVANIINRKHRYKDQRYCGGGHFWMTRGAAELSQLGDEKIVRCRAKKKDVTSIGRQEGYRVIVLKKATFPKWVGKAQ
jgi:hypothetical protein